MAFTTTSGNPTTIQGTTLVDILSSVDLSGNFIVKADKEADAITLTSTTDPSQLTDVSVYGQDGADTITSPTAQLLRGRTQGGSGADTITYGTINTYKTYGGADADTITATTAVNSTVQGSKGNDTIGTANAANTVGTFTVTASKVYGGADNDTINAGITTGSTVQGSAGNDTINLSGTVSANSKVNGGSENDTINILNEVTEVTKGSTINGNKGSDQIVIEATAGAVTAAVVDEVTIFGGSGADTLDNNGGRTTLSGDKGADTINTGTGDKVSVSGGEGDDTINGEIANTANFTTSLNGGEGNDGIALANANTNSIQKVQQGRTDSTAATAVVGNGGAGDAIANGDTVVFGNGVDVVTNMDVVDDLALGLTTTGTNITIQAWDEDGAGGAGYYQVKNLVAGALNSTTSWGELQEAGRTVILGGNYAGNTFTVSNLVGGDDLLVIQADGNALTANTSMMVVQGLDVSVADQLDALGQQNVTGFDTYVA